MGNERSRSEKEHAWALKETGWGKMNFIETRLKEHNLVSRAIEIAVEAHKDQKRKSDGSAYIHHPIQVGLILAHYGFDASTVAAGILHDTLEDTKVTFRFLERNVGRETAELVRHVTEPPKKFPWEARKAAYFIGLTKAPAKAVAISVADRLDNRISLIDGYSRLGREIFSRFNRGVQQMLEHDQKILELYEGRLPNHPMLKELHVYIAKFEEIAQTLAKL